MLVVLLLLGFSLFGDPAPVDAVVNQVIDGSTLDAQIDGVRTPVGYLGVETPALNTACGERAAARNRELAGKHVTLQADPAYSLDDHHRVLYYAYANDSTSIDATLISEGLAHAARTDASRGGELAALEAAAQADGVGCIWS